MGALTDFLKKAFGESHLAGKQEVFGRNPGLPMNPQGILRGVMDSSGGPVRTTFGDGLEQALVAKVMQGGMPMPSSALLGPAPQMMGPPQGPPGPQMGPPQPVGAPDAQVVPFNPQPMDQGTPLAPPPPQIHDATMYAQPTSALNPQNAPMANMLFDFMRDPNVQRYYKVWVQQNGGQSNAAPIQHAIHPVHIEMSR